MTGGTALTSQGVQDLVAKNRVAKAANYHASQKGIRFADIVLALMGCIRIDHDRRPEHPKGWVAFCPQWGGTLMRVHFNLENRDDGDIILVVTAMDVVRQ